MTLRVVFAGTPEFAETALAAIHAAGFEVPLVLTQPDRPAGRGMKLHASPVKQFALAHGLPVAQPPSLKRTGKYPEQAAEALAQLRQAHADVMVVAAYGLLLPQEVLDIPRYGCLNIHASLLPRWRGAAPIHRAIEAGDHETGITIMQMDAGLDTGAMVSVARESIGSDDTTATLHDRLASLGARQIVSALAQLARDGGLPATPQPADGVTYAAKISKDEAVLDWTRSARELVCQIRAFDPFPGATTELHDTTLKVWGAQIVDEPVPRAVAGTVLSVGPQGVVIACGAADAAQAVRVTHWQKPGGKRLSTRDFLQGFSIQPGERLGAARSA
ncbi:methionyl-tRNA formyltransferase [Pandoraea thiooxydans]|uniref:Methionyl-tRNA formyltransferase n=1 Tax=Pandoraea thiooxydans TaxID=445709 RepID=A0A0G3EXV3_9BURK|nr:methionyl-tRNA formyltransferase [Pandoraea thiooxydans]AKJ69556.1 methionyl-tRNA formyltransferase [Pandoraea thiooxydans]APR97246.1 methionyl-tRNA formyltransferase [Pandoraea thiooxydans]